MSDAGDDDADGAGHDEYWWLLLTSATRTIDGLMLFTWRSGHINCQIILKE